MRFTARNFVARAGKLAALACGAALLAGCSSGGSLLEGQGPAEPSPIRIAEGKRVANIVAYRPALGPPDEVGAELTRQLNEAAAEHDVALVIDTTVKTDHALRGYVTAMRKGPAVNITYLWDVLDQSGRRLTRISGEEMLRDGVNSAQPWGAVTPAVSRMIAQKTMSQYAQWARANSMPVAAAGGQAIPATPGAVPALAATPR